MTPLAAAFAALQASIASPIEGQWANPGGSVVVAIAPCGEAYCGTVVSASDKAKTDARKGGVDELVGTELLSGFVAGGNGQWKGRLFVPDLNKRTKALLRQLSPDQLKIKGCVVGGAICKSQIWTRAVSPDAGN